MLRMNDLSAFYLLSLFLLVKNGGQVQSMKESHIVTHSPFAQRRCAKFDIELVDMLQGLNPNGNHISAINRYINDYHDTFDGIHGFNRNGTVNSRVEAVVKYPTAIYRFLWRLADLLPDVVLELNMTGDVARSNLTGLLVNAPIITLTDVDRYAMNFFFLHQTSFFNTSEAINGVIAGYKTGIPLRPIHALQLAIVGAVEGPYMAATEYLELVLEMIKPEEVLIDRKILQSLMECHYHRHDWFWEHTQMSSHFGWDRRLLSIKHLPNFTRLRHKFVHSNTSALGKFFFGLDLCKKGFLNEQMFSSPKLICWLDPNVHPYWVIHPLKVELSSEDAGIFLLHDFFREGLISTLKELASPRMYRSTVNVDGKEDDPSEETISRRSMDARLKEWESSKTAHMPKMIELATGLKVALRTDAPLKKLPGQFNALGTTSELLQISAYTPGGYFLTHQDELFPFNPASGGRLLTFMVYLEEPEVGGYTAFPGAGIAVKPTKGTAVLWYNMKGRNVAEYETMHAGCPVIVGNKWISTKWIFRYDQFLVQPCPLDPAASFSYPYRKRRSRS